jgi:hypothetical protein
MYPAQAGHAPCAKYMNTVLESHRSLLEMKIPFIPRIVRSVSYSCTIPCVGHIAQL